MYGLLKDFDANPFRGQELIKISFTSNTIDFIFGGEISITLESSFIFRDRNGKEEKTKVPVLSSEIMRLIGKKIESARAGANGALELVFDKIYASQTYKPLLEYKNNRTVRNGSQTH